MRESIGVRGFQDTPGRILADVRYHKKRYVITNRGEEVAALVPMEDLERLEGNVSEEQAEYVTNDLPDLTIGVSRFEIKHRARRAMKNDPIKAAQLLMELAAELLKEAQP